MSDNAIGLHLYSIQMRKKRNREPVSFSALGDGSLLRETMSSFVERYSNPVDATTGTPRSWFLDQSVSSNEAWSGLIQYGTSGYESEIVDGMTRELQYKRAVTDIDVIPLYYRFFLPMVGNYGMAALQTFGQKSCVNRIQQAFFRSFQNKTNSHTLDFRPLSPIDLEYFQNGLVKSITVIKRKYTTDAADNAVLDPNELVDVDVSYRAMPKSYLGKLSQFVGRLKNTNEAGKLIMDDEAYDEASAFVDVAGKRRKIVILGTNHGGGKIDVSEDVRRLPTGHPRYDSIDEQAVQIMSGVAAKA